MTDQTPTPAAIASPVYVDQQWHDDGDQSGMPGERAYRATDDPRLLAIIERDSRDLTPDGDAYAPAFWATYRGGWDLSSVGSTFGGDDEAEAVRKAWDQWGQSSPVAARFLNIFHGVTVHHLRDSSGDLLVILDTPAHRDAMGGEGSTDEYTQGDRDAWRAWLDGDVWGVGHAVNPLRTDPTEPVDLDDEGWTVAVESWGYFGDDWAHEAALELGEAPDADALDALTAERVAARDAAAAREAAPAAIAAVVARYDAHLSDWAAAHPDEGPEPTVSEWVERDEARFVLLDALVDAARPLL